MTDNLSRIKRTSQAIDNFGFDEDYMKPTVEILTENEAGTELTTQKKIATEAKQDSIIENQTDGSQKTQIVQSDGSTVDNFENILKRYEFIDGAVDSVDDTIFYVGKAKIDGTYLIYKYTKSVYYPAKRAGNIGNNATRTTFAQAWANRETLTYDYLFNLTNL